MCGFVRQARCLRVSGPAKSLTRLHAWVTAVTPRVHPRDAAMARHLSAPQFASLQKNSLAFWLTCLATSTAYASPPQRIVSLNLCVDQILVDLVPRQRIAAVTHLAADAKVSAAPQKFGGIPFTRGAAEDVLTLNPDLVIAGAYTTPATIDLLRRLGRRVVVVPLPDTLAGVRDLIGAIADAAEAPDAGRMLIAAMDARIAASAPRGAPRPAALVYQINNYITARGSLLDEALEVAGFQNAGRQVAALANGKTSLETIVAAPPDVLVLATEPDDYATAVGDNLRHPALEQLRARIPNLVLPWPLWLCGTHHIATAIEQLAVARRALSQGAP